MTLGRFHHQSGIALGPILFIIAIIAILAAVISAGSGGFNVSTSTESAKAMAETITNYVSALSDTVQMLRANGCSDTQISFENGIISGYTNPNSPMDHSCNVFDPRGGNMVWHDPPAGSVSPPAIDIGNSLHGTYFFHTRQWYSGLGTDGSDTGNELSLRVYVTQAVCQQINQILYSTTYITTDGWGYDNAPFVGSYLNGEAPQTLLQCDGTGVGTPCFAKVSYCLYVSNPTMGPAYYYTYALIIR